MGRRRNVGEKVIHCYGCGHEVESSYTRGGPSGLPESWISIVAVTNDREESVDAVTSTFSGLYCSTQCYDDAVRSATFSDARRIMPSSFVPDVVSETREMQATRIGLTVLDVIHAIHGTDASQFGALIPLTEDFESLPGTYVLTVMRMNEEDVPEAFQERGEADGLAQ